MFLATLSAELELDPLPVQEGNDLYKLELNPQITVTVRKLDPGFSFWSPIGSCPEVKKEELFTLLMKANFLGQGTGGATIALNENGNYLTLSSTLPYDMNYKTFRDALEGFINFLEYWKEELIQHKKAAQNTIF